MRVLQFVAITLNPVGRVEGCVSRNLWLLPSTRWGGLRDDASSEFLGSHAPKPILALAGSLQKHRFGLQVPDLVLILLLVFGIK